MNWRKNKVKIQLVNFVTELPDFYTRKRIIYSIIENEFIQKEMMDELTEHRASLDLVRDNEYEKFCREDENSPFDPVTGRFKKECTVAENLEKNAMIDFILSLPEDYSREDCITSIIMEDLNNSEFNETGTFHHVSGSLEAM